MLFLSAKTKGLFNIERFNIEVEEENEKNVKKVEKTLDKTTPKPYTYMSEEEKMAETKNFIEKRIKEIENYPYRKKEN